VWKDTCGELRGLMKDIFDLKMKSASASEISEKRIQASLMFVTLKKLNRLEKLRIKRSRDATNQSKQSVDSFNLQLQNLLYEVLHLKKEVTKCVNFKSADENLSLISTEQFYEEAPTSISCPDVTENDEHALRLARLQWELSRREELSGEAERREVDRERLENVIRSKEDKLRELGPQLTSILSSTVPVQDYLGLPLTDQRDQQSLAKLLPASLYILYTQCHAYGEACDKEMVVRVVGDAEEARTFKESDREDDDQDDAKDDSQDPEADGEKLHRSKSVRSADKKSQILSVHPLHVDVDISSGENRVSLSFHWIVALGVVTVTVSTSTKDKVSGECMANNTFLSHLYPGDTGLQSPNAANKWQLATVGMTDSWEKLFPHKVPYVWVQRLAGLQFLKNDQDAKSCNEPKAEVSEMHIETTVKAIRFRLVSRIELQKQIDILSQTKFSLIDYLPSSLQTLFPVRVISKLKSWAVSDWESYNSAEHTMHLISGGIVNDDCSFYKAVITRDKAVLTAMISISPSYPEVPPAFSLSLQLEDRTETSETSEMMRDFEREVNIGWEGPTDSKLLLVLLHRMLVLLDVVLEVYSSLEEEFEGAGGSFLKSQVFFDTVRGKMRRLPLYFNRTHQMFEQR